MAIDILNHFKVWLPHITSHKLQLVTTVFAEVSEKAKKRFGFTIFATQKQPSHTCVYLINSHQVTMGFKYRYFINPYLLDTFLAPIRKPIINHHINRAVYSLPESGKYVT